VRRDAETGDEDQDGDDDGRQNEWHL